VAQRTRAQHAQLRMNGFTSVDWFGAYDPARASLSGETDRTAEIEGAAETATREA